MTHKFLVTVEAEEGVAPARIRAEIKSNLDDVFPQGNKVQYVNAGRIYDVLGEGNHTALVERDFEEAVGVNFNSVLGMGGRAR